MIKWNLTMKTPGFLTDTLFYLRTLTIVSVSSIALQISSTAGSTSDANTFTNYENLEVEAGELRVKATGKNTTEFLTNLLGTVVDLQTTPFSGVKSSLYTPPKEKQTTKRPDKLFLSNVLTESLTMERLRTIIQTSSDAITGKTTLMLKILIASTALSVGFLGSTNSQCNGGT